MCGTHTVEEARFTNPDTSPESQISSYGVPFRLLRPQPPKGAGGRSPQKACLLPPQNKFLQVFRCGPFPHPPRGEPRRALGDRSWNVTWRRECTAPLTEGGQVPGRPRPGQLSGLARSPTPGGGQAGGGRRENDARLVGRGGERGPQGGGGAGEADSDSSCQVAGRARPATRSGDGRGAHLPPARTEGARQDLGLVYPPQGLPVQPLSAPGRDKGRADGRARPQPQPRRGWRRETGDTTPERRNQFGRSGGAEGKGRPLRTGARTRGGRRRGSHWGEARARGAAANWTRFSGPRASPRAP